MQTTAQCNRRRLRGKQSPPRAKPPPSGDIPKLLQRLPRSTEKTFCRSCFAQQWKGRCYRCRTSWAQRLQSHFCISCYTELFPGAEVGIDVFKNLPFGEWHKRWGPEWFEDKFVGMRFPFVTGNQVKYFVLSETACLTIAEEVPSWGRHLQRLCGQFEGKVPLTQTLMD